MSLISRLLRIRIPPPGGGFVPGETEVTGTPDGAINVNVVSGDIELGDVNIDAGAVGAAVDAALRDSPLPVTVTNPGGSGGASAEDIGEAVDTELRASPLPVSGTVAVSNQPTSPPTAAQINTALKATAQPVSGPLTDTQLRATAVPVSGTVTANGPLTNTQLRASAVPVSGTVALSNAPADPPTAAAINTALKATAQPVSGTVTVAGDYLERIADAAEDTSPVPTNILMGLGAARRVTAGSTSASQALTTSGIAGISITAIGADIRYNIGAAASATSHYLPEGQSRDIRVGASAVVHAMRAGSTDGVLEITELLA